MLIPATLRDAALLPRYARVNVLKVTMGSAIATLKADGWTIVPSPPTAPSGRSTAAGSLKPEAAAAAELAEGATAAQSLGPPAQVRPTRHQQFLAIRPHTPT
jgi:hypothetical protein